MPSTTVRLGDQKVSFDARGAALYVLLAMPGLRRSVDVSVQPALVARLARDVDPGRHRNRPVADLAAEVAAFAAAQGAWAPADPVERGVVTVVGGAAFPILGLAYERGAAPLARVPRWAAGPLRQPTARDAASEAFGDRATRTVIRALAASLLPAPGESSIDLGPFGLALMGRDVLEPDQIARVLLAGPVARPAPPTVDDIAVAAPLIGALGARMATRVLVDAAASEAGVRRLAQAARMWRGVGRHVARLPGRLDDLHAGLVALHPVDPDPDGDARAEMTAARRRQVEARAAGRRPAHAGRDRAMAEAVPIAPRRPPPARRPGAVPAVPLAPRMAPLRSDSRDAAGRVSVHDHEAGDRIRLVEPRTSAEMWEWGNRLRNCIGDYVTAVREGRSHLVGVEVDGRLTYCVEITATLEIRQFLGAYNRPPDPAHAAAAVAALRRAGALVP